MTYNSKLLLYTVFKYAWDTDEGHWSNYNLNPKYLASFLLNAIKEYYIIIWKYE